MTGSLVRSNKFHELGTSERLTTGPHLPMTGPEVSVALPYATIQPATVLNRQRMSAGIRVDSMKLVIRVWSDSLDELKQLENLIARCFEGADFHSGTTFVLDMRLATRGESRQDDGIWRLESVYSIQIETKERP